MYNCSFVRNRLSLLFIIVLISATLSAKIASSLAGVYDEISCVIWPDKPTDGVG